MILVTELTLNSMVSAVQPADMLDKAESQETLGLFLSSGGGGMTKQVAGIIKEGKSALLSEIK